MSGRSRSAQHGTDMPQVVSANRLSDGIVVFRAPGGKWIERLDEAATFADKAALDAAVADAQRDVAANVVVDIFPFEVTIAGANLTAVTLRDRIRTRGPTVHLDHGKQALPG